MTYVSTFEVLSEYIVPPPLLPPGSTVPFVLKGYFLTLSRLAGDGHAGDLHVRLRFHPSVALPPVANLLVDEQTAAGGTKVLALNAQNEVTVQLPPGGTALAGIQPNFTNSTATGPLVATFGLRGYVSLAVVAPTPTGVYRLGLTPEIRAIFCTLQTTLKGPVPDFSEATDIAYALPTPQPLLILEH